MGGEALSTTTPSSPGSSWKVSSQPCTATITGVVPMVVAGAAMVASTNSATPVVGETTREVGVVAGRQPHTQPHRNLRTRVLLGVVAAATQPPVPHVMAHLSLLDYYYLQFDIDSTRYSA